MNIFVSHYHEDAAFATALKDLIEDAFDSKVRVFVSSDARSLPPGTRWEAELWEHLETSSLFIIILSPNSVFRPWVTFEAGAACGRKAPIRPICIGGLTPLQVGSPLNKYQSQVLRSAKSCREFLAQIATDLRLEFKARDRQVRKVVNLAKPTISSALPLELFASFGEDDVWDTDLTSIYGQFLILLAAEAIEKKVSIDLRKVCEEITEIGFDYANGFLVAMRAAKLVLFRSDFKSFWIFDYIHPLLKKDLKLKIKKRIEQAIEEEKLEAGDRSAFEAELKVIQDYIQSLVQK